MNLDAKLDVRGNEKIIIPSITFDIYTRLEILLGLESFGHIDILTKASNLIDKLYERRENQNEQQYPKALDKFNTQ